MCAKGKQYAKKSADCEENMYKTLDNLRLFEYNFYKTVNKMTMVILRLAMLRRTVNA